MSQETNLNVSPYFDDFDPLGNYNKILFKPGYPVQARELTGLQSILQDQIEKFGRFVLKDGARVIGGEYTFNSQVPVAIIDNEYLGESVSKFLSAIQSSGVLIKGRTSGATATVKYYITDSISTVGKYSLYLDYINTGSNNGSSTPYFVDGEVLEVVDTVSDDFFGTLQSGQGFAVTSSEGSFSLASVVDINSGIYFVRGYFVTINKEYFIISQYSSTPTGKVGLEIQENIVNSFEDSSLNDNAKGFTNYAAPGADRLRIELKLKYIESDNYSETGFIELFSLRDGEQVNLVETTQLGEISKEFARRTFDESGDYYVKQPQIEISESLNDYKGNGGYFEEGDLTYNGRVPSQSLGIYKISPAKAYVRGFEITTGTTFLDFEKPRESKLLKNQSINYFTGPTYSLNRVFGSPEIGLETSYTVSLRDSRSGSDQTIAPGKEIGVARVYDFALESGSYDSTNPDANVWDIALYDIQTYTEITLSENVTLTIPTFIKGNSSGASGYLTSAVTNSNLLTVYSSQGKFSVGESFSINGEKRNLTSTAVNQYESDDVKSIYGFDGVKYFSGDTILETLSNITYTNITASDSGISTVTTSDFIFSGIVNVGDIVSYTIPGNTIKTFSEVNSVSKYTLGISSTTSVSGVCDGDLPIVDVITSDFKILTSSLQSSSDNTLYTQMPKQFIKSVDLSKSEIIIKKQFSGNINAGTFTASTNSDETFLPFDEERYVLVADSGETEILTQDKFVINSNQITINGLQSSGNAKLIATLRKVDIKSRIKNRNRIKTLIVDKSRLPGSGIGNTTLNDGLTYGNYPYGTRVQDEDICLLVPDVNRVFAIIQSTGTASNSDPQGPSVIFSSLDGASNTTNDLIVGEEFVGQTSKTVGLYSQRINDGKIEFVYLNNSKFISGEQVTFKESGVSGEVSSTDDGDLNITSNYTFVDNQKNTIYDYSKVVRKSNKKEPNRKIKIIFEASNYLTSDDGQITTANSYDQYDYCNVKSYRYIRNSDLIDLRPRVDDYTVSENSRSPFEFLSRSFTSTGNSSTEILASDESFRVDYDFYLPRIDKILLSKDGKLQVTQGKSSENPGPPLDSDDAITIASTYLSPYLCNIKNINVKYNEFKRYRMSDIRKLENRIQNLEYYTSLNLLEQEVASLEIQDESGLNRFKSGFYVDNFTNTFNQRKTNFVKNSIDVSQSELRPSLYTTCIDLKPVYNIAETDGVSIKKVDQEFNTKFLSSSNIKLHNGRIVTLDYEEVVEIENLNSTRVENVKAFSEVYYKGTVDLYPTSDVWMSQERLESTTTEFSSDYSPTQEQIETCGPDIGFCPGNYGGIKEWYGDISTPPTPTICDKPQGSSPGGVGSVGKKGQTKSGLKGKKYNSKSAKVISEFLTKPAPNGTFGTNSNVLSQSQDTSNLSPGTYQATTSKTVVGPGIVNTESLGDSIVDSKIIPFMRSRNIRFNGSTFKPLTPLYPFFDGINMSKYIIPKLLEIQMITGTFVPGEVVQGFARNESLNSDSSAIRFRVANSNHKFGDIFDPDSIYVENPYTGEIISEVYTSTSSILNIDCFSLANNAEDDYYGFISSFGAGSGGNGNFVLRGESSGAEAYVTNLRLVADKSGSVSGILHITPGSDTSSGYGPKFTCGTKTFRLTSSPTNSKISGVVVSSGEVKFYSEGILNTIKENIISVRIPEIETIIETETTQVIENIITTSVPAAPNQGVSAPPSTSISGGPTQPPTPPTPPEDPTLQYRIFNQGNPNIIGESAQKNIRQAVLEYGIRDQLTPSQEKALFGPLGNGNLSIDQASKIINKLYPEGLKNGISFGLNVSNNYQAPSSVSNPVNYPPSNQNNTNNTGGSSSTTNTNSGTPSSGNNNNKGGGGKGNGGKNGGGGKGNNGKKGNGGKKDNALDILLAGTTDPVLQSLIKEKKKK